MVAWFFVAAFFAEIIGTIAGFGSSTILMPIALFFYDFHTALPLVALFHVFGNIGRIAFFRKVNKRLLLLFGIPSVILALVGAYLVTFAGQDLLKILLGLFLLAFAIVSLARPTMTLPRTSASAILGGGVSGFLAGLIGTGGALRSAFLTATQLEKTSYIATAASIAILVDLTRIPVYLASGFLIPDGYWYLPVLFIIALAGAYTGKAIVQHIPQRIFRAIVLVVIALVSIKFILDGLTRTF